MREPAHRIYDELAWLWPLWGSPADYRVESELVARLIREHAPSAPRTLLEIGCGGGNNAFTLKGYFELSGIDISEPMLEHARRLNPECAFTLGDMRSFTLPRRFDAVFLGQSVVYMNTREDLRRAMERAFAHVEAGGVFVCFTEVYEENFIQNDTGISISSRAGSSTPEGADPRLDVVFIQNKFDPDPEDEQFSMALVMLIRRDGALTIEHDVHTLGVFPLDYWRVCMREAGFVLAAEVPLKGKRGALLFVCTKPAEGSGERGR
ncbi:class I SAM-dependent DNA methyltransferase [Polyangium mundeleinium]|uniref:Methyltransferase domain-containing protein n=1 Tax=Polyangium mundeleinium TaxID=2995306 RepID=A0ABT5EM68_9BACT|nr:class I SAM-dependent methyltransferase [Polyangium mundeleinium]MDC0742940.1 methyltransferase domain-containing protein [Polyangium mundeleinium]